MFLSSARISEILEHVDARTWADDESLLLLLAERDRPDADPLVRELRDRGISFFGGVFPALRAANMKPLRALRSE